MDTSVTSEEFQIPAPWGTIAGKSWGELSNEIIIMVHGLQDNAACFDKLIQYLPNNFCYKCIDLPGHGLSSHFPEKNILHSVDYVLVYRIIVEYFKQDKYIFIGHSWGAQLSLLFTQFYPVYTKKIVLIDAYALYPLSVRYVKEFYTDRFEKYLYAMMKMSSRSAPKYTYEEALSRLTQNRAFGGITREVGKDLMSRAVRKVENDKYVFTMDQRLKFILNPQNDLRQLVSFTKTYPIKCPILVINASESKAQKDYFLPVIKELNKQTFIKQVTLEGNHNIHMISPEVVGPIINRFLMYEKSKL